MELSSSPIWNVGCGGRKFSSCCGILFRGRLSLFLNGLRTRIFRHESNAPKVERITSST